LRLTRRLPRLHAGICRTIAVWPLTLPCSARNARRLRARASPKGGNNLGMTTPGRASAIAFSCLARMPPSLFLADRIPRRTPLSRCVGRDNGAVPRLRVEPLNVKRGRAFATYAYLAFYLELTRLRAVTRCRRVALPRSPSQLWRTVRHRFSRRALL